MIGAALLALCAACAAEQTAAPTLTMHLDSLVTFGAGPDGESVVVDFPLVTRDGQGRWYAADIDRASIHRFAPDGAWELRIGASGDGPGEFRRIAYLHGRADGGVEVYDQRARRITTIGSDGRAQRSIALDFAPVSDFPARRRDGRYVANGIHVDANAAFGSMLGSASPMHLLDSSFVVLRSFGASAADSGNVLGAFRQFALAANDDVWTLHEHRYEIERFDTAGRRVARFTPTDLPFPPRPEGIPANAWPGPPNAFAIWEDSAGRVLTGFLEATDAWQPARLVVDGRTGVPVLQAGQDPNAAFVTVLDARDAATGALLARGRFPVALRGTVARDTLFQLREDANGGTAVTIWRLRLTRD